MQMPITICRLTGNLRIIASIMNGNTIALKKKVQAKLVANGRKVLCQGKRVLKNKKKRNVNFQCYGIKRVNPSEVK